MRLRTEKEQPFFMRAHLPLLLLARFTFLADAPVYAALVSAALLFIVCFIAVQENER